MMLRPVCQLEQSEMNEMSRPSSPELSLNPDDTQLCLPLRILSSGVAMTELAFRRRMDESGGKIEDVDERRLNRVAYEYLCRLLQVRIWLAECLKDEQIVNVNELEENLRNGVLLARLAHSFAPEVVPLKGVFDVKQERFQQNENTPVYRHSDNIMQWRRAMESIHLPEIFIPETADVFEGRNQKTVFCLCALATLLHRLRKAPPMRNVAGQAKFHKYRILMPNLDDELSEMKLNLKDSKLPEFGDVGSLLTGRRENADLQARAIETIRDAVKSKDATELVKALKSSEAGIEFVEENLAEEYLVKLTSVDEVEFTKPFVQRIVVETNNESALEKLDRALGTDDGEQLLHILDVLQFDDVRPTALLLYSTLLQREKKNSGKSLDREKVAEIIAVANALVEVRVAVDHGSSEDVLLALRHPALQLNPSPNNARLYYNRIRKEYESKAEGEFLTRNELEFFLIEYDDISADKRQVLELKAALANKDDEAVLSFLKTSTFAEIVIEQNSEFYITKLKKKIEMIYFQPTSLEELGEALRDVNEETGRAFSHLDTLIRLNKAMTVDHESSVRLNLVSLGTSMKSDAFRRELLHWYIQRLIKESQHRLAQVEPRNELEKKWLHFDFEFGTVWAETVTLHRSTVPMEPVDESYFTWEEIERMLDEEDVNFDEYYKTNEQQVVKSQKNLRKFLEQKRKKQMEARQKSMEQAALTIQNHYKSYRNRKDLELLKSAEKPSLSLVRKFVKNLPRSEVSTSDEFEVAEMKSNVAQLMAANRQLDANLVELDEKIGLLIKNRLNLEEVMAHRDKTAEAADAFSMRAISMRKRDKLPLSTLEQLFFYLQTQPAHLANLIEARGKKGLDDLINDVICPIFGFLSDNREQFLMVRMLCELITRDVEKMNRLEELPTTNCVQTVAQFFTSR
ncbi:unnamed protein product [Caenorhabditis auriculariae]|uniref:Calponin-homology (CH) domain-containing protein n=1 Tax=Caenorhabditis auriculariae TaxID=2777116 RepID=A0A8S1H3T9_9PELO|nr:unnamed protein product [Caenorhabditis auriculariae]